MLGTVQTHSKILQEFTAQGLKLQDTLLLSTSTGEGTSACLTRVIELDTGEREKDAEEGELTQKVMENMGSQLSVHCINIFPYI